MDQTTLKFQTTFPLAARIWIE